MAATYCTVANVQTFLQLADAFSGSTTPTTTVVTEFIERNEDYINSKVHRSWKSITVTNEYYDYDGSRRIDLNHRNIVTLVSGTDKIEVWNHHTSDAYKDFVADYTEGRGDDFWIDYTLGILYFEDQDPSPGHERVRMTYRYYESTVPKDIEKACILLTAADIIANESESSLMDTTSEGSMVYDSRHTKWKEEAEKILDNYFVPLISSHTLSGPRRRWGRGW